MKKTIFTAVLTSLILFSSSISKALTGVTVDHGMLVFASKTTYISLVGEFKQEEKTSFVNQCMEMPGFVSLLKSKEINLDLYDKINDDFFSAIINGKGYVQIENFIYKVNPSDNSVYVFPSSKYELMPAIDAGIITNPEIRFYSMDDDVIGMVSSGTPPSNAKLFCGDDGCKGDNKSGTVPLTNARTGATCSSMDAEVIYLKLGVYFTLKAKVRNFCPERTIEIHITPAKFKVKCGYTYGPLYQWNKQISGSSSGGWMTDHYYQGIQPLNGLWLRVVFMAKDAYWNGNPDNPSVDLEIRRNM